MFGLDVPFMLNSWNVWLRYRQGTLNLCQGKSQGNIREFCSVLNVGWKLDFMIYKSFYCFLKFSIKKLAQDFKKIILDPFSRWQKAEKCHSCQKRQFHTRRLASSYEIWAMSWENWFCHIRTTKAQISLRIRAFWSAPLLFAAWVVQFLYLLYSNFKTLARLISWAGRFES